MTALVDAQCPHGIDDPSWCYICLHGPTPNANRHLGAGFRYDGATSKEKAVAEVNYLLGISARHTSSGPERAWYVGIAETLAIPYDPDHSMCLVAREIVEFARLGWTPECHYSEVKDTYVTGVGVNRVRDAVRLVLLDRSLLDSTSS